MSCVHCDELLDEMSRLRKELADCTWERDTAEANYARVRDEIANLRRVGK